MSAVLVVTTLVFLTTLVAANPAPLIPTSTTASRSVNPLEALTGPIHSLAASTDLLTNAERLSRGLPPRAPKRRYVNAAQALAPRSSPTPCRRGYIRADGPNDSKRWFRSTLNMFGEYRLADPDQDREPLSICTEGAGPFNIETAAGLSQGVPYVGLTSGFANTSPYLASGTYNYAYFTRTEGTPPNSPPSAGKSSYSLATGLDENIESAIWTLDAQTGRLTPRWVNPDGSTPPVAVIYVPGSDAVVVTVDVPTFMGAFGSVDELTLFWVPADDVVTAPPAVTTV